MLDLYIVPQHSCILGEPTSGKSAVTQVFHSDGSHFPKSYLMVVIFNYLVIFVIF